MDQLKNKVVNVVLTIQEGKGMDSMKNLAVISANFNGRILDSDPVAVQDCPIFNSHLIWEVEKRDLRKVRSCGQLLRVECYSIDQKKKEKFGHILLDLKSAQIVNEPTQNVSFKWYKLLGVRAKKRNCMPELYLSLSVRNQEDVKEEKSVEDLWQVEPRGHNLLPIKFLEDGYILIGDQGSCAEDFSLQILIQAASSLDLLLPELLVFHQNTNKYYMSIKIFGIPINTKSFTRDLQETILFDEKIVIRLLSNSVTLDQFFAEESFQVEFFSGSDLLGSTTVNFNSLSSVNTRVRQESCLFKFPSSNGIVPVSKDGRKPSVSLELLLLQNKRHIELESKPRYNQNITQAAGDYTQDSKSQQVIELTEKQINEFLEWKEQQKVKFEAELQVLKEDAMRRNREEMEAKTYELEDNIKKYKELYDELEKKRDEMSITKALRKKRDHGSLISLMEENCRKFTDCDQDSLIEYISSLQQDNDNLKKVVAEQKQSFENFERSMLTKEQTTSLLQELKGLEEKFEVAQQNKTYFKEQWKRACQEIHYLKTEDYKQIKNQIREQRDELNEIDQLCIGDGVENFY